MSFDSDLNNVITSDANLFALVGKRVRPMALAQIDKRPCIVYDTTTEPAVTFSGPATYGVASVTIGAYADTRKACNELSTELRRVLHGRNWTGSGFKVGMSILNEESDIEQEVEDGKETSSVFLRTQSYRMLYKEI